MSSGVDMYIYIFNYEHSAFTHDYFNPGEDAFMKVFKNNTHKVLKNFYTKERNNKI
jgi:CRISPR/Cas system endoribonuclease Cas6 (RAMP superfamily)